MSQLITCLEHGLLHSLVDRLCLVDLNRLACTSKAAAEALSTQLSSGNKQTAKRILLHAVREASQKSCDKTNQRRVILCDDFNSAIDVSTLQQQIRWLVRQVGSVQRILQANAQETSPTAVLLQIPHVQEGAAIVLVQHGFRFTYQQLLSAVHSCVPGVEVWVQTCRFLGIHMPDGMPAVAEVLCCNSKADPFLADAIPDAELPDIMQLAVMMPTIGMATSILADICNLAAARQLNSNTAVKLIDAAIKIGASDRVALLAGLPAAQQLPADTLTALIQAALAAQLTYSVRLLCELPAARQVTPDTAYALLQQAVQIGGAGAVHVLGELPAARRLEVERVLQLMRMCQQLEKPYSVYEVLLHLRSAVMHSV